MTGPHVLVVFSALLCLASGQDLVCTEAKIDLCFLIDSSSSISWDHGPLAWPSMIQFIVDVIDRLEVSETGAHIAAIRFSLNAALQFRLNANNYDKETIKQAITDLVYDGSPGTNTRDALQTALTEIFNGQNGDRPDVDDVCILITDGRSTNPPGEAVTAGEALKNAGTRIIAIGVSENVNYDELNGIASLPLSDNVFTVSDFSQLEAIIQKLVEATCVVIGTKAPTTTTTPTPPPVTGCPNPADLVIAMDVSGSINEERFAQEIEYLVQLVNVLDINSGRIRVAGVTFGSSTALQWNLNAYTRTSQIVDALRGVQYTGGTTNTASLITFVRTQMFTNFAGKRDGVAPILLLISDGNSNDQEAAIQAAYDAKTAGIYILTVAVGGWVDQVELETIASHPYEQMAYKIDTWNQVAAGFGVIDLRNLICNSQNDCFNSPCQRGSCIDEIGYYVCRCPTGYGGSRCDKTCQSYSDVAFAIDASGSIGSANFRSVLHFVRSLVLDLPINSANSKSGVALITYSDGSSISMPLRDQDTKEAVLNNILMYYPGGTTDTAGALNLIRTVVFTTAQGDSSLRQNVVVSITDGKSNNQLSTWSSAISLRQAGGFVIPVGVGSSIDMNELYGLATYPSLDTAFSVADYPSLNNLVDPIYNGICQNIQYCANNPCQNGGQCSERPFGYTCACNLCERCTGKNCERLASGVMDIIFMIDVSGSIQHERFYMVQDFIINIIEELEIASSKTRVGVITFSNDARVGFHLNAYQFKEDVQHAVRRLSFLGGGTNIATALRLVRNQGFVSQNGARDNAPNMLMIFSDGQSNLESADTIPEAILTRQMGITIFVASVGDTVRFSEIWGMASHPKATFTANVASFSEIVTMVPAVVTGITDDVNECAAAPCQNGACLNGLNTYACDCVNTDYTGKNCQHRCTRQMDVVLVLDVSGSREKEDHLIVEFGSEFSWLIPVENDRARLALVTYSASPSTKFNLNTYANNKFGVMNAVEITGFAGLTNIASAAELVGNSVFNSGNGARPGVPKKIVFVTDAWPTLRETDVNGAAANMRQQTGGEVFVVAVGPNPNQGVANALASDPDSTHVYYLTEANQVQPMATDLATVLCTQ